MKMLLRKHLNGSRATLWQPQRAIAWMVGSGGQSSWLNGFLS